MRSILPGEPWTVEEICQHEAGHVVAHIVLGRGRFHRIVVFPASSRDPGGPLGSFEIVSGSRRFSLESVLARMTTSEFHSMNRSIRDSQSPGDAKCVSKEIRELGAVQYAGIAAMFGSHDLDVAYLATDMATASQTDRALFRAQAALLGGRRRPMMHFPSWRRACAAIDPHWGRLRAIASALEQRCRKSKDGGGELLEGEILAIWKTADNYPNPVRRSKAFWDSIPRTTIGSEGDLLPPKGAR